MALTSSLCDTLVGVSGVLVNVSNCDSCVLFWLILSNCDSCVFYGPANLVICMTYSC